MRGCAQPCGFAGVASSRVSSRFAWPCDPGATRASGRGNAWGSAHVGGMRRKVPMDELHCHRSFAYRGRTALRRTGAHVAGGEDAGDACLEESGDSGCFTGEDVTLLVSRDGFAEPLTARSRTEEEEHEREGEALAARKRDSLEGSLASVELGNLAAVAN